MEGCSAQPGGGSAFQGPGKTKEYDEAGGKAYPFTDDEKDNWANLFEYTGSEDKSG